MLDVLLLLALPASGKSELRRYVASLPPEIALADLHLGPTVQVDDFPYVHLMRRVSAAQEELGLESAFFADPAAGFNDPREWITLIHLINEDVAGLESGAATDEPGALLDRLTAARAAAGIPEPGLAGRPALDDLVTVDAAHLVAGLPVVDPTSLGAATTLIEFARGGPEGAAPPLPFPFGYQHSLAALSPSILSRAAILYVRTTPEESRRRNRERAIPGDEGEGSVLHHGVPEQVLRSSYGMDDIEWLTTRARIPGTVPAGVFDVPVAIFDNVADHTSFLRAPQGEWPVDRVEALHDELRSVLGDLARRTALLRG